MMRPATTRRLAAGIAVAGLAAAALALAGPDGSGATGTSEPTLQAAGLAMGGSWTDAQVRRYASQFDLVVVGASADAARVRRFHESRPGIVVLAYTCGFDVHDDAPLYGWIRGRHPDWFLTDAAGRRLHTYRDRHRWALDCGLPAVRAFFADSAHRRRREIGADGIFEDNVMPDWNGRNLAGRGARLARYATPARWREALELYLAALERAVAPAPVAANQVRPWTRHGRIVAIEEMPPGGEAWTERVRGLAALSRDRTRTPLLVHALTGPDDPARAFVTASYLMAVEPGALLCLPCPGPRDSARRLPEQSLVLGRPLGPARNAGGVWWRDFERARILVNPTARPLPGRWPGAAGGPVLPARGAGIAWRPGVASSPRLADWVNR